MRYSVIGAAVVGLLGVLTTVVCAKQIDPVTYVASGVDVAEMLQVGSGGAQLRIIVVLPLGQLVDKSYELKQIGENTYAATLGGRPCGTVTVKLDGDVARMRTNGRTQVMIKLVSDARNEVINRLHKQAEFYARTNTKIASHFKTMPVEDLFLSCASE